MAAPIISVKNIGSPKIMAERIKVNTIPKYVIGWNFEIAIFFKHIVVK